MDKTRRVLGNLVSEVMNLHSRKLYQVLTFRDIGKDYWTTDIFPIVPKRLLFGFITRTMPDCDHPIVSFVRNTKDDADEVHMQVRHIVLSEKEENWLTLLPRPTPAEGYSEGAKKRLRELGFNE